MDSATPPDGQVSVAGASTRASATLAPVGAGALASSISRAVVRLFAEYLGRGPTKARTVIGRDVVTVVLEDTFTRGERTLVERGQEQAVLEMRRAMQQAMREPLVEAVESLAGRRVLAFLSDQQISPDFALESFVLEPLPPEDTS